MFIKHYFLSNIFVIDLILHKLSRIFLNIIHWLLIIKINRKMDLIFHKLCNKNFALWLQTIYFLPKQFYFMEKCITREHDRLNYLNFQQNFIMSILWFNVIFKKNQNLTWSWGDSRLSMYFAIILAVLNWNKLRELPWSTTMMTCLVFNLTVSW